MTVEPITKPRKPSAANDTPKVYAAIAAVMTAMGKDGIRKERENKQQNFMFRGIDDVYNALAPMLAQHDLVIIPRVLSREQVERKTSKGYALFYVTCQVEFTLICSLDGSSVQCVTYGEAMDSADKATNKAMSAAYKYMAMQTFCIPTEGDNDADATTHEVAPAAGGERTPAHPPARQQQSSAQAKKDDVWGRFERTLQSFRDVDELESWWADADTQAKIETMPKAWQDQAAEAYEKRQEALLNAGRP